MNVKLQTVRAQIYTRLGHLGRSHGDLDFTSSPTIDSSDGEPSGTSKHLEESKEPVACLSPCVIIHSSLFNVRLSYRDKCCATNSCKSCGQYALVCMQLKAANASVRNARVSDQRPCVNQTMKYSTKEVSWLTFWRTRARGRSWMFVWSTSSRNSSPAVLLPMETQNTQLSNKFCTILLVARPLEIWRHRGRVKVG